MNVPPQFTQAPSRLTTASDSCRHAGVVYGLLLLRVLVKIRQRDPFVVSAQRPRSPRRARTRDTAISVVRSKLSVDPNSEPTGNTIFVLSEVYETPAGVAEHWKQAVASWQDLPPLWTGVPRSRSARCTAERSSRASGSRDTSQTGQHHAALMQSPATRPEPASLAGERRRSHVSEAVA